MNDGFDVSQFDKFTKQMIDIAQKKMPKELNLFMNEQSRSVTARTKFEAKAGVFKESGDYHSSIKKRRTYKKDGVYSGGVYSADRKAHLLEHGHDQIVNPSKGPGGGRGKAKGRGIGKKVGVVAGRKVFSSAADDFHPEFYSDLDKFVANIAKEAAK